MLATKKANEAKAKNMDSPSAFHVRNSKRNTRDSSSSSP
jgi:hypothetical protein